MNSEKIDIISRVLDKFSIETPSWSYSDGGDRSSKFSQPGAARNMEEKLADAGQVHAYTGCSPAVATHYLWDFDKCNDTATVVAAAEENGIRIGSVNPDVFLEEKYKFGSLANPNDEIREDALHHIYDCIELAKDVESKYISLWFADGTNYPGQDSLRARKKRFEENLELCHERLADDQILLIEYKPFDPAFYQSDIADWGMALLLAEKAGPQAKVLVDPGHHYASQNIEQIVAWLLDEHMLGGIHFNDRQYASDGLTVGSIDPYQIFRIFYEIHNYADETGGYPEIAYMIDQSNSLKPRIEAMIQSVMMAQELYAKAAIVNHEAMRGFQESHDIVSSENELRRAFFTDVTHALEVWRDQHMIPLDPLAAYRESGYQEEIEEARSESDIEDE